MAPRKTTLVKLLLGLQAPTAGYAQIFDKRVTPNASDIRQRIGYLPTNPKFPPTMTPITYLDLLGQLFGMPKEERMPKLSGLIRAVDLLPAAARPIKTFSTGMTTRLGIAASLMNDPDLLIWDEPTAGLDPAGRKYTLDLLRELGKTKTIIVSSHILTDIDRVCDHVGILHDGKMIFGGSVREMKETIGRNNVDMEIDALPDQADEFCRRLRLRFRRSSDLSARAISLKFVSCHRSDWLPRLAGSCWSPLKWEWIYSRSALHAAKPKMRFFTFWR